MNLQKEYSLDQFDISILKLMQSNARISSADIAYELDMAPFAVLERVKKLEQKNIILQYTTSLNPLALHQGLLADGFIKPADGFGCSCSANELAKIPEVQEVHHVAGEDCYPVKIRTIHSASLMYIMRDSLIKILNILTTRTTIVLETVKEQQQLVIIV